MHVDNILRPTVGDRHFITNQHSLTAFANLGSACNLPFSFRRCVSNKVGEKTDFHEILSEKFTKMFVKAEESNG